jgi:hypothetical protein
MVPRPPSLGAILFEKSAVLSEARVCNTEGGSQKEGHSSRRHCGTCGKAGHNTRTYQEDVDISSSLDSE